MCASPINPKFYFDETADEYHPVAMFVKIPPGSEIGEAPCPLEFGAEIKFMSWNIAKWTTRFDAWRYDFLDYKYPPEN